MRHPELVNLALYAGGDLGPFASIKTRLHVTRCAQCSAEVELFSSASQEIKTQAAELPQGVDWDQLAAEMRANIKLGLEADSIASHVMDEPRRSSEPFGWRATYVLAAGTLVVITGWFLHVSPQGEAKLAFATPPAQGISIEATQSGLELKVNGGAMTLRTPEVQPRESQPVILTVSSQGSANARYVDSETGQVTINNVSFE